MFCTANTQSFAESTYCYIQLNTTSEM